MADKYEKCRICRYKHIMSVHYPCDKCEGGDVPTTCKNCRYDYCDINPKGKRLRTCKNFEWD